MCEGKQENKFMTVVDPNKCLKQIKLPIKLYTRASSSKLPSDISAMSAILMQKRVTKCAIT